MNTNDFFFFWCVQGVDESIIRISVLTFEPYFLVRAGLGISYRQEFFKLGIGKLNIGLSPAQ